MIEGRLQLDTWDDKQTGQKRSKLKVIGENLQLLGSRDEGGGGGGGGGGRASGGGKPSKSAPAEEPADDDIPF
jgi:single-strand DNA-binding protein